MAKNYAFLPKHTIPSGEVEANRKAASIVIAAVADAIEHECVAMWHPGTKYGSEASNMEYRLVVNIRLNVF